MSKELHAQNIQKATLAVRETSRLVNPRFRQKYHFMAPAGWLNDPNGLIQFGGQYHLFYQHNPYGSSWGPMHWGHAVSRDLVHWEHLPVALAPSEDYESGHGGCFSGSAVEKDGRLTLLYTGASTVGGEEQQVQCLAQSTDGVVFEKYAGNPVLKRSGSRQSDFRDPKVWRHGNFWYMVVASQEQESGAALLYRSADLLHWRFISQLAGGSPQQGRMWECPDFFELGGTGVLLFSPVGFDNRKATYLTGRFDYDTGAFSAETLGETDWGFDFYAAQSFPDAQGRRIVIGWANGWDWMPWWNGFGPTQQDRWCGHMSLPREVTMCADGRLAFHPVSELQTLRTDAWRTESVTLHDSEPLALHAGDGIHFELLADFDLTASTSTQIRLLMRCSETEQTVLTCDLRQGELIFDRSASSPHDAGIKRCPLESAQQKKLRLHVFADTCSVEVFTDSGRTVLSSNLYPAAESTGIFLCADGGDAQLSCVETWGLA